MKKRNYLFLGSLILLSGLPISCSEEASKLTERREESLGDLSILPDDVLIELAINATIGAKTVKEAYRNAENFLNASRYLKEVIKPRFHQTSSIQELRELATFEKNKLLLKKYEESFLKKLSIPIDISPDPFLQTKANAALKQPDGKVIIVGNVAIPRQGRPPRELIVVMRYNSDGSLDSSFGKKGIVIPTILGHEQSFGWSVALQPDKKILVGGSSETFDRSLTRFALARYDSSGLLDKTFNASGEVPGIVITSPEVLNIETLYGYFSNLAIQPNGKIVAAGYYFNEYQDPRLIIVRYNADGTLDTTFGDNGRVLVDQAKSFANYIFVKSNGDIVFISEDSKKNMKFTVFNSSGKLIK